VAAGLAAAGTDTAGLELDEETDGLAERFKQTCTAGCLSRLAGLAEVAPDTSRAALVEGVRDLLAGCTRAGVLFSASVPGLLGYHGPGFLERESIPESEIREFVEAETVIRAGLAFAVSSRFAELRKRLGLEI